LCAHRAFATLAVAIDCVRGACARRHSGEPGNHDVVVDGFRVERQRVIAAIVLGSPANLHGTGCVRLNPDERTGVVRVAVHDDEARFRARHADARNEKRCNEA